jgi:hypothetical protein
MKRKKATGFVGWAMHELKDMESKWNKVTRMLEVCGIRKR